MGRRRKPTRLLPLEDDIAAAVLDHWRVLGLPETLVAGIPNKRAFGQVGLTPGLPDLLVITPFLGRATGYIELKRVGGRRSDAQIEIGSLMERAKIPYAVTYGRDQPIDVLEAWGAVRPSVSSVNAVERVERGRAADSRGVPPGA
jgi:hypothetical protein